ncbi:MAG TPA: protein kinase [Terriglobia bacterium]|nr:protein kinase [Terriglobia bacterium]
MLGLAAGAKLGPYEILSPLGAGGMGEVYQARDTRLGRDVAVKVLAKHLISSPDFRQRFEREARTLSSLQHPHICVLHDIGHDEVAGEFLVMEFLEGETVAERLKRGKLPLQELLKIGMGIADALDKAHRKGLTHRDLKPANIMLTKSGSKLMDFGLAKPAPLGAVGGTGLAPLLSAAMTADGPSPASPITSAGSIIGTIQYMSPEQIEGKEADARSDIFAFGATLYEMATGARAFPGKSQISVASAILEKDPEPISKTQPLAPASLDHVIAQCLAKNPEDRFQSAQDVGLELKWIAESATRGFSQEDTNLKGGAAVAGHRPALQRALPWAVAGILFIVGIIGTAAYFRLERAPARAIFAQIPPPANTKFVFNSINASNGELSPDGSRLLFLASGVEGVERLWVLALDSTAAQPLVGTEHAFTPFWSPDSKYVGFFADGKLKKIDIGGGAPVDICDASWGRGGTWATDGTILFAPNINSPIERVSAGGGTPVAITTLNSTSGQTSHRWPEFLPDGQHFIFFSNSTTRDHAGTYVASVKGGEPKLILKGNSNAIYAQGFLLFVDSGNLMAQQFDLNQLQLRGDPVEIQGKVGTLDVADRSLITASATGVLAYWSISGGTGSFQLKWFDRAGKQVGASGTPTTLTFSPRLSRDGKRLAFQVSRVGGYDIWITDLARDTRTRLTFNPATNTSPVWSPDGIEIAFSSNRSGINQIFVKSSNGTEAARRLLNDDAADDPESWSADGRYLAFQRTDPQRKFGRNLWILPLFGDRKPYPFIESSFDQLYAEFSPDVKWLAYTSDETGRPEVYIAPFPKANGKWEVSTQGGVVPTWRRDGKELYYLSLDQKLMAVDIRENNNSVEIGSPHVLFQTNPPPLVLRSYDSAADSSKFIVVTQSLNASSVPVTLVINWPALLEKK